MRHIKTCRHPCPARLRAVGAAAPGELSRDGPRRFPYRFATAPPRLHAGQPGWPASAVSAPEGSDDPSTESTELLPAPAPTRPPTTPRVFTAAGSRSSALRTRRWRPTNTEPMNFRPVLARAPAGWGSPQYADDRGSTQRGDRLRQSLTPREQVQPPGIPAAAEVSCQGRSGHPEHEPAPSAVRGTVEHRENPHPP
jgi:hypothetical protein